MPASAVRGQRLTALASQDTAKWMSEWVRHLVPWEVHATAEEMTEPAVYNTACAVCEVRAEAEEIVQHSA